MSGLFSPESFRDAWIKFTGRRQEQHDLTIDEQRKKKGFLKSKTTTTHDEWHDSIAVTTTLSGETVTVAAGRDLTSQGAQIAGTGDVLLAAGRDVVLDVAQNTHTEVHDKTVTKSGLFSGGGVGFTIGKQRTDTTADIEEKTHTGSLIGSTDGRVDIAAGRDVTITGSDVLSRDGIGIIGQNVTIQAAEDSTSVTETQKFKQTGINVSLKGGAVDRRADRCVCLRRSQRGQQQVELGQHHLPEHHA